MFMKVRDTAEAYAGTRERHSVGIPSISIDDEVIMVRDEEHIKEIIEQYGLDKAD